MLAMNQRTPDTDIPDDGGPLTDREILEGILDELDGIPLVETDTWPI